MSELLHTRLMGSKSKDTPSYPLEEVMNSNSLGLSDIRSRNLRKAEAGKKQLEAKKFLQVAAAATSEASTAVPVIEHNEEASEPSVEPAVKKKRYSIKVEAEPAQETGGKDIINEEIVESEAIAGEALDPAEFARQERLRKQREKQVKAKQILYLLLLCIL